MDVSNPRKLKIFSNNLILSISTQNFIDIIEISTRRLPPSTTLPTKIVSVHGFFAIFL
ncbi:MAG: hypothetical protein LN561_03210 [Rickettsia endosymbiont of Labidopullus appendiculatus]|nr:hypothetical protein [Rickettsia endosymbiont of Labidopullus appendiculatus]